MGDIIGYDSDGEDIEVGDHVTSRADGTSTQPDAEEYFGQAYPASSEEAAERGMIEVDRLDHVEGSGTHGRWIVAADLCTRLDAYTARTQGIPTEEIDWWHDQVEDGINAITRAFNEKFADSGNDFRFKDEHRKQLKVICKQILPFMSIPETVVIMQFFEVLLKANRIAVEVEQLGIDVDDTDAVNEAIQGLTDTIFGQKMPDPTDIKSVESRIKRIGDEPEIASLMDDDEESPADKIMRMSRSNQN